MAAKYVSVMRLPALAADPSDAREGQMYFSTLTLKIRIYKTTGWTDL